MPFFDQVGECRDFSSHCFQVVRMVVLLGLLGCVDYIRGQEELGSGGAWSGSGGFEGIIIG